VYIKDNTKIDLKMVWGHGLDFAVFEYGPVVNFCEQRIEPLLDSCSMLVSYLAFSSNLKMEDLLKYQ
jgi:hypothetical protein